MLIERLIVVVISLLNPRRIGDVETRIHANLIFLQNVDVFHFKLERVLNAAQVVLNQRVIVQQYLLDGPLLLFLHFIVIKLHLACTIRPILQISLASILHMGIWLRILNWLLLI